VRLSSPPDLPRLARPPQAPTGPRFVPAHETLIGGPGDPPPGFLTGQNSLDEWWWYWASAKVFDDPKDPRQPPFFGGEQWGYQIARMGGFVRALGSAVVDFVYYQDATVLGVRIQTERFHQFTDASKQGYDVLQRAMLEGDFMRVVDVYDEEFLGDPSGQRAVLAVKRVLNRIERVNPVVAGTAYRASRIRPLA